MKGEEIKRLVAKSENAAVEFKRARGDVRLFSRRGRRGRGAFLLVRIGERSSVAKGLGVSAKSVWRAKRAMKEIGLLVREGGDKSGKWIVRKAG